ncbi:hypothetical protein GCM10008931_16570 [Oceanobacillus oncorhynchi subsp. oncorhynchi]
MLTLVSERKTRRLLWESAMVFGGASNRSPSGKTPQEKSDLLFFEEAERKPMESVVFFRSGHHYQIYL